MYIAFEYSYRNLDKVTKEFWTFISIGIVVSLILLAYCIFPRIRRLEHRNDPPWPIFGVCVSGFMLAFFIFFAHIITFPFEAKKVVIDKKNVTLFYAYPKDKVVIPINELENVYLGTKKQSRGRIIFKTKKKQYYRSHVVYFKKQKSHLNDLHKALEWDNDDE